MLTHLIHFTMLDAFNAVVIWGLYTAISSHTNSDDNKSKVESTTVEQDDDDDDDDDDDELFKPYHQTLYLDHGMTLLDWQRACEQDYMHLLDKRDFELYRDNAIYGSVYRDCESGQTFVYTKNGLVKMKGI